MAPTATKNTDEIDIDVGILYAAPIGTTEPTSATATLATAWREIGYTEDGSSFSTEITTEEIEVEELLDPIQVMTTKRVAKLSFQMAQITRMNLLLALNQGAAGTNNSTTVEPVALTSEVRVMLFWLSEATGAHAHGILARQAYNTGGLTIDAKKAPSKRLLPVEFTLEKPTSAQAFAFLPSNTGEV